MNPILANPPPAVNEKEEVVRVICAALDNDMCRIKPYKWGYGLDTKYFDGHLAVDCAMELVDTGSRFFELGQKRMEQIVAAIQAAQARGAE